MNGILGWVRATGFAEGLSALALFGIAMPMKYIWGSISAEDFRIIGMAHGILWVFYGVAATIALCGKVISFKQYLLLALFSLPPLGPILADRWVLKRFGSNRNPIGLPESEPNE